MAGDSNAADGSKPSETQSANLTVWGPSEDSEWLKDMEEAFGQGPPRIQGDVEELRGRRR